MNPHSIIVPSADYQRMFQVMKSVLDSVYAHTTHACIFFAEVGAAMLNKFYGKQARCVSGKAFYLVDGTLPLVVSFTDIDGDGNPTDGTAFHCWIECDGFAVDFLAPLFRESLAEGGRSNNTPRRMFQRRLSVMASSPYQLEREGDFHLIPNEVLTREKTAIFLGTTSSIDLGRICLHWYRKPPSEIDSLMEMKDERGNVTRVPLTDMRIDGMW